MFGMSRRVDRLGVGDLATLWAEPGPLTLTVDAVVTWLAAVAAAPLWPPPAATEPQTLSAAYERCRQLHARHGRSYYLATLLLPRWKRPHVHALYGFVRYADEIVDDLATTLDRAGQAAALTAWGQRFFAGLRGAPIQDPILPAVLHTVRAFDLDVGDFEKFLHSMAMDLRTGGYVTYQDLLAYMEGSAAVIGTMLTPILESVDPPAARRHARQLGLAFQLTNFLRDLAEDLQRGRVYLPAEDLDRFGVRRVDLAPGPTRPAVQALVAFEIDRARAHYAAAAPGIELLVPSSRPCVRVALALYGGILTEVERAGYQVLDRRVAVPRHRRLAVAGRHWAAARAAARAERRVSVTTPGAR
jgi:phytoene synthase